MREDKKTREGRERERGGGHRPGIARYLLVSLCMAERPRYRGYRYSRYLVELETKSEQLKQNQSSTRNEARSFSGEERACLTDRHIGSNSICMQRNRQSIQNNASLLRMASK